MHAERTEIGEARRRVSERDWRPRNCVWELTLACNLRCMHCGSRAGEARACELSQSECLEVVRQLADLGCEVVTLSGGEPTLRDDWDTLARATAERGIFVNMVTNGVYRSDAAARDVALRAAAAGMCNVGVSIDGPLEVHDRMRGAGTFARAMTAVERFREAGLRVTLLTTVSRLNLRALEETRRLAIEAGAAQWRLQLAKPMGSLGAHRDAVLAPAHLLGLVPLLARLARQGGIEVRVGDSIGYYGPHDAVLRGRGWRGRDECWQGCQAGMQAIGIEADGGVKGCLSLQAKWGDGDPFVEGNVRHSRLDDLWHRPGAFAYNRELRTDSLTGSCSGCRHASLCRGGARCVSSAFSGVLTEDPYCYYRVSAAQPVERAVSAGRAAMAAAMLAVSLAGCGDGAQVRADGGSSDAITAMTDAASTDAGAPDAGSDAGGSLDASQGSDAGQPADAALLPEAGSDAAQTTCEGVCCECDYGIIPPEVLARCCAD